MEKQGTHNVSDIQLAKCQINGWQRL